MPDGLRGLGFDSSRGRQIYSYSVMVTYLTLTQKFGVQVPVRVPNIPLWCNRIAHRRPRSEIESSSPHEGANHVDISLIGKAAVC